MYFITYMYAGVIGVIFFVGISLIARKVPSAYRILGVLFLIICFNILNAELIYSGFIRKVPHLFRIASPLQYLISPLYLFFVRYLIYPNAKWHRWYWVLFLPFLLHVIEMTPFYIQPIELKQKALDLHYQSPYIDAKVGLLGFRTHVLLKTGYLLVVMGFVFSMLKPLLNNFRHALYVNNKVLIIWLLADYFIKIITYGIIFCAFLFYKLIPEAYLFVGDWLFFADTLFNAIFLIATPRLLQGLKWEEIPMIPDSETHESTSDTSVEHSESVKPELLNLLNQYMQYDQPFLNERLTVEMVANYLGVKSYRVSKVIKEYHGISFTDYINSYRLNYIDVKLREDMAWKSYSIESMAFQAGFGSRTTFYAAFRKLHDCTPAEYYGLKGN